MLFSDETEPEPAPVSVASVGEESCALLSLSLLIDQPENGSV